MASFHANSHFPRGQEMLALGTRLRLFTNVGSYFVCIYWVQTWVKLSIDQLKLRKRSYQVIF